MIDPDPEDERFFLAVVAQTVASGGRTVPASPQDVARLREMAERRLPPEEFEAGLAIPLTDEEVEENLALIRWFRRRYPTPAERLAYVRRAYARWKRAMPPASYSSSPPVE